VGYNMLQNTHTHTHVNMQSNQWGAQHRKSKGVGGFMERLHGNQWHSIITIRIIITNSSSIWAELGRHTHTQLQSVLCNTDPWTMAEKRIARFICFCLLRSSNEARNRGSKRRTQAETLGGNTSSALPHFSQ